MNTDTPYAQGYNYSLNATPPFICPYPSDTHEYEQWWEGFSDAVDDLIAYNNEP